MPCFETDERQEKFLPLCTGSRHVLELHFQVGLYFKRELGE